MIDCVLISKLLCAHIIESAGLLCLAENDLCIYLYKLCYFFGEVENQAVLFSIPTALA